MQLSVFLSHVLFQEFHSSIQKSKGHGGKGPAQVFKCSSLEAYDGVKNLQDTSQILLHGGSS